MPLASAAPPLRFITLEDWDATSSSSSQHLAKRLSSSALLPTAAGFAPPLLLLIPTSDGQIPPSLSASSLFARRRRREDVKSRPPLPGAFPGTGECFPGWLAPRIFCCSILLNLDFSPPPPSRFCNAATDDDGLCSPSVIRGRAEWGLWDGTGFAALQIGRDGHTFSIF